VRLPLPESLSALSRGRAGRLLAVPAAPLVGARLAHAVNHPPRPGSRRSPADFGLGAEELRIPVPGANGSLHAWKCPGDPRRVVVLGHTMGSEKSRSLTYAGMLAEAGWTVVLFDFRNHGESFTDRALTGFSGRFADDLVAVVEYVRAQPEHRGAAVALYGISMSSFAVLKAVGRLAPLDAVVCDSGPAPEPAKAVRNLLRTGLLPLPRMMREPPARALLEAAFVPLVSAAMSVPREWPPPPTTPGYATTPMLFVVGEQDRVLGHEEVAALADSYPGGEVTVVPGAGHLRTMKSDPERYRKVVLGFLAGHLGEPGGGQPCDSR
jgi:uncharacterized protein